MYPYNLPSNPFPSSPTTTLSDAHILGGKRHKEALESVKDCITSIDLKLKNINNKNSLNEDLFKIITVIQDVGSGKTHLALHLRSLKEINDKCILSYIDLAQIHPRKIDNFFHSMVKGLNKEYFDKVRKRIIEYLQDRYSENPKLVKKIIRYGFFDTLNGNSVDEKLKQILDSKIQPSYSHLFELMSRDFTEMEINLISEIVKTGTLSYSDIKTFDNLLLILTTISRINYKLYNKITIFQVDEFDSDSQTLDYMKGLINSHIPYSVVMFITTPSYYSEISRINPSLFDRLEKANYKIDLAGSNSFDEINDIVLEYLAYNNDDLSDIDKIDITSKIKIIYDEFPDFRNIRSIINVLYHAMELSLKKGSINIDEQSIEETIKNVYPGLRLRGSIMGISISDFIKMRKISIDRSIIESSVKDAVKNLIDFAEEMGTVRRYGEKIDIDYLDAIYNDQMGKKIGVTIAVDEDKNKNFDKIVKSTRKNSIVDKLIILTTNISNVNKNGTTLVTVDRWKLADLLYFNKKYSNKEIKSEDPQKVLSLAKSMHLC